MAILGAKKGPAFKPGSSASKGGPRASKGLSKGKGPPPRQAPKGFSKGVSEYRAPASRPQSKGSFRSKGSAPRPSSGPPKAFKSFSNDQPRTRIIANRITGTIQSWKGKFGWIVPDQPIRHPKANANGGKVYLAMEDVEQELSGVGGGVSFYVYADGQGIGAMRCIPSNTRPMREISSSRSGKGQSGKGQKDRFSKVRQTVDKRGQKGARSPLKAKGKKASTEEKREPGAPPDKESREVLSEEPLEGLVVKRNGVVGWVKVDEPLEMCEGKRRLYFHTTDVDGEEPEVGAKVVFFPYKDNQGFGAESIQVMEQGDGTLPPRDDAPAEEGEEGEKKAEKKERKAKGKGEGKGTGRFAQKQKLRMKAQKGDRPKKEKGPSGPDLPRERVIDEPIVGEVISWKKNFGWIKPTEEIDHPKAELHEGRIYVHQNDIVGAESFAKGDTVKFYVFLDASGLGAEEASAV